MTTGDSHNGSNSQHRLSDQVSANTKQTCPAYRHRATFRLYQKDQFLPLRLSARSVIRKQTVAAT